jgi:hypothetical protein
VKIIYVEVTSAWADWRISDEGGRLVISSAGELVRFCRSISFYGLLRRVLTGRPNRLMLFINSVDIG